MTKLPRKNFAIGAFLATTALSAPVGAQQYSPPTDVPPVHSKVDQFNVDLVTRKIAARVGGSISIGPSGPGGLRYIWTDSNRAGSEINAGLDISGSKYSVFIAGATTTFTLSGALGTGTFSNDQGGGETLTYSSASQQYTFTTADGAVLVIGIAGSPLPASLTYPAGEQLTWNYDSSSPYTLRSVTSNLGYQYRPTYTGAFPYTYVSKVVLFNMNNETCDPFAVSCTLVGSWPTIDFVAQTVNGNPIFTWNEQANSSTGGTTVTKTIPISSTQSETLTYEEDANGRVTSVTDGNGVWNYSYQIGGGVTFVTGNGTSRTIPWNTTTGLVTSDIRAPGNGASADISSFGYDSYQRLNSVQHNGVTTTYTYDGKGNITRTVTTDSNNANPITTLAAYPTSGCNAKTCNQPTSTTDANGNVTTYAYDSNSGGVSSITYPAVSVAGVGAISPVVTYSYSTYNETWKNGSGGTVTGSPVYRPQTISRCMTQATCSTITNPNDQVLTTVAYDTTNGLQPSSVTTGTNGSASPILQATTGYSYTPQGDVQTIDGPLSGTADTTWYSYDLDHRLTGTISASPGNGQPMRAVRVSYTSGGLLDTTSMGTATAQSAAALSSMTMLQKAQTSYNAQGLKSKDTLYDNSGAVAGLTDYNYTPQRLLQCIAVRNTLTSTDACTQTTGGRDLITKYTYDGVDHVLTVRNGYTSDTQTPDVTNTWLDGAMLATLKDGNGKTTTYTYDTFNRLNSTCYPDKNGTTGASSTTDCEIPSYDNNGNILSRRLRDGSTTLSYTYDAQNRLSTKVLPEGTVTYGYDLLGHATSIAQGTTSLSFTYDQLGRNLNQTGPLGTVASAWDTAGRRTQLTYPDNSYINYDYLTTGDLQKIRENGATTGVGVLATYTYDALGNRGSVTFGNGAVQSYTYDPLYRPQTLTSNLEGAATSNDVTHTLSWNPVSQLTSLARSNSSYIWARGSASYTYAVNPLNQYTSNGSTSFTYDALGNLHTSGGTYYCYNSENRLTGVGTSANCSATATLAYDPLGRLAKVVGGATTQFAYDELNMVAEYNSSNVLQAKYVFGPGVDEPIVAYDSAGNRTFLSADERGSIIALTNSAGTVTALNAYDEYGMPKSDASGNSLNSGRFQYTGQAFLAETGMYYYKNRMYSPTLGRFLQADPIGYGDGPNWYAYARNDPVKGSDPTGLSCGIENHSVNLVAPNGQIDAHLYDYVATVGQCDAGAGISAPDVPSGFVPENALNPIAPDAKSSTKYIAHDPVAINKKARELIAKIQACKTQVCARAAWAEYDRFRKSAGFLLERAQNYDRHVSYHLTALEGGLALLGGWGEKSMTKVLAIFGLEKGAEHFATWVISGGERH